MDFVDREEELGDLRRRLTGERPALIRVFGRRRLGKTTLLLRLVEELGGLLLVCEETGPRSQLAALARQVEERTGERPPPFRTFPDVLRYLERARPRFAVLDEFPRLAAADRAVPSQLQRAWDERIKDHGPGLVLCGSSIGMMERLVRRRPAPLFGRVTASLKVRSFGFGAVRLLYPGLPEEERVRRYAVFGGTPFYHELTRHHSLEEAVKDELLSESGSLADEPSSLLRLELKEPSRYNTIMQEIGQGTHDLAGLAARIGVGPGGLAPYLRVLRDDLDLLRMEEPVCGKRRIARYVFSDPFFSFYHRFVFRSRPRLELGDRSGVWEEVAKGLDSHVGRVAEEIAREALIAANGSVVKGVMLRFHEIGRWWNRQGEDIDIVARGPEETLACEVKWTGRPAGIDVYRDLERKAGLIEKSGDLPVRLGMVSWSGFTGEAREALRQSGGLSLEGDDLVRLFDAKFGRPGGAAII